MEFTTFILARILGPYFLLGGLAIMLRYSYFIPVVGAFAEERLLRFIVAIFEFISGLIIVNLHPYWTGASAVIISITGWLMLLEGAGYLIAPDWLAAWIVKKFNVRGWYIGGGLLAIVIGLYLSAAGFGLII